MTRAGGGCALEVRGVVAVSVSVWHQVGAVMKYSITISISVCCVAPSACRTIGSLRSLSTSISDSCKMSTAAPAWLHLSVPRTRVSTLQQHPYKLHPRMHAVMRSCFAAHVVGAVVSGRLSDEVPTTLMRAPYPNGYFISKVHWHNGTYIQVGSAQRVPQ